MRDRNMGDIALKQIANAVPRGLLYTVYEVAVFELQRALDISGVTGVLDRLTFGR